MELNCEVSAVLPAYNEEATIEEATKNTMATLESFLRTDEYEVVITEDDCDDATPELAARLATEHHRVRHLHSDESLGKGGAIARAFKQCHGEILVFLDADLSTNMESLQRLVERIQTGGYDVATGSRYLSESDTDRSIDRKAASLVYNRLVRLLLSSEINDHQCGFKAFDREAALELLRLTESEQWFWDTEMLVRAQNRGYEVCEIPVKWRPASDTEVDLVTDGLTMAFSVLQLWWGLTVSRQPAMDQQAPGQS